MITARGRVRSSRRVDVVGQVEQRIENTHAIHEVVITGPRVPNVRFGYSVFQMLVGQFDPQCANHRAYSGADQRPWTKYGPDRGAYQSSCRGAPHLRETVYQNLQLLDRQHRQRDWSDEDDHVC